MLAEAMARIDVGRTRPPGNALYPQAQMAALNKQALQQQKDMRSGVNVTI